MLEAEAAVAIVHTRGPEECVLLMRRTEREEDPWSGHWSFPGGRRDPEDPDLVATALRELGEECGIELTRAHLESAFPAASAGHRSGSVMVVARYLFALETALPTVLDPREAAEALWIPLAVLREPRRHRLLPVPRRPKEIVYPAIDLNGTPLWGFTYRTITDWLGLHPQRASGEPAGMAAARRLLDFLLQQGTELRHGWKNPEGASARKVATVSGPIPVEAVLADFSQPCAEVPGVSFIDVAPDRVKIVGLALEEYLIQAG